MAPHQPAAIDASVDATLWTLRLAFGTAATDELPAHRWTEVLQTACHERCAAVAWLRSGQRIRHTAPAAVVARWRSVVLSLVSRGEEQLHALGETVRCLSDAGCAPIVLKGAPLSARLYGEHWARATADVDVYVEREYRRVAGRVLAGAGWAHVEGVPPGEETFVRAGLTGPLFLELHSSLQPTELAHLPRLTPSAEVVELAGYSVPALCGPVVAPYLAVHLAKHQLGPLLWLVDFWTLRAKFDAGQRLAANEMARRVRVERYLAWATSQSDVAFEAAERDSSALGRLGFTATGRRDEHPLHRDVRFAATRVDAARALGAWLFPRPLRAHPRRLAARWRERIAAGLPSYRVASSRDGVRTPVDVTTAPVWRPIVAAPESRRTDGNERLVRAIRSVIGEGGGIWVRVTGNSMAPTFRDGDRVLLEPPRPRPRRADVVFTAPDGAPLLHRVVEAYGDSVRLRGDASRTDDAPVCVGEIVARAAAAYTRRGLIALEPTRRFGWRALWRFVRAHARWHLFVIARRSRGALHRLSLAVLGTRVAG